LLTAALSLFFHQYYSRVIINHAREEAAMHILLVEDDAKLGFMIQYKLNSEGHQTEWAHNSEEAEMYFAGDTFDLYILDWMLPGETGLELCRKRRGKQDNTAILMLTARDAIEDRVNGLLMGADDYLVKPFAFEELFARITALDRRKQTNGYEKDCSVSGVTINPHTQEMVREGVQIYLTKREFQLMEFFIRHSNKVLSRERILNNVWGSHANVTLNTVDAMVKLLRKKIDDPFSVKLLISVHGRGYRLLDIEADHDDS
jgi:DNA-binding response OmpR family regulator